MKILQAAGSLKEWGGIERYVIYLSQGLTELGSEVVLASPLGSPLQSKWNGKFYAVETPRRGRMLATSAYLRVINEVKPDVVHAHYSPDFAAVGIAARIAKVPRVVMTRHVALPWALAKARALSSLFDTIICVSEAVKTELLTSGVPKDQLVVARMGLDQLKPSCNKEEARNKFNITGADFVVGFVGRLILEKGVTTLLHAIQLLQGIPLHIFGDGPQRAELEALSESLGINNRVFFHGNLGDVADAMVSLDVLVVPSEWKEAFPAVILEAMSIGIPVIASSIGGIPEIIKNHENGLLFPPRDSASLSRAILEISNSPASLQSFAAAGFKTHQSEYTLKDMARRFQKIYVQSHLEKIAI